MPEDTSNCSWLQKWVCLFGLVFPMEWYQDVRRRERLPRSETTHPDSALRSCLWSRWSRSCSLGCSPRQSLRRAGAACGPRAPAASSGTRCYWGRCLGSSERPACPTRSPAPCVHSHRLRHSRRWQWKRGSKSVKQMLFESFQQLKQPANKTSKSLKKIIAESSLQTFIVVKVEQFNCCIYSAWFD